MKSMLISCVQDVKRLLTNALFWVLTATLVVIVLVVNLALPKEVALEGADLVTWNAPAGLPFGTAAQSEQALRETVRKGGAIGFLFGADGLTIVNPGYAEQSLNVFVLELMGGKPAAVQVERLDPAVREMPFNLRLTPIFLCFEALMVGFTLGGALMLSEKQDGTVRALRVSPFGAWKYVAAKTVLFSLIGTLYASLISVFTVGFSIHWGAFLLLSFFGTAIFTMIGLAYTTPFRDMSGWFFSMVILLSVNMLPVISYSSPAFTPFWMRLIPSYPILMAYRGAMFGGAIDLKYTLIAVFAWTLISFGLALWFVAKKHLRGART